MESPGRVIAAEPGVSWIRAIAHGAAGRCPACGRGRLFGGFLRVAESCEACGQELHHHRADDFPPYVVIFIVSHIVGTAILIAETRFDTPLWLHLALWPLLTVVLCLVLLQPVKGAVVGMQYALGMHGFGDASSRLAPTHEGAADRPEDLR